MITKAYSTSFSLGILGLDKKYHDPIYAIYGFVRFSHARLNTPGAPIGNWQWRYTPEQLDSLQNNSATYLKDLLKLYGRA